MMLQFYTQLLRKAARDFTNTSITMAYTPRHGYIINLNTEKIKNEDLFHTGFFM